MDFFLENSNHPSHLISHNTGLETFEEQGNGPVKVERAVGLFGGISLIIGTMIGSGIFASAAAVSKFSGSVGMSLVIWAASGTLAMFGGLCYVELGLMLPESGGEYIYIKEALGDFPAFLNVYVSNIVLKPASFSAICVAAGDYVVEPFLVYEHVASNKVLIAKLIAASAFALKAEPALKPNQPNHSIPAPNSTNGIFTGWSVLLILRPITIAPVRAAIPADICTTVPPA